MSNPLTLQAGIRIGPIVLETLVKHYFERLKKDTEGKDGRVHLRKEELLYDEAFSIVKAFLEAASYHTVEEVQGFSNTRTPSPPWVHVVRLVVPISCCNDAAIHLTQALGGEAMAKRVVGGTKWWQVRGIDGVNAQWITAKKDWKEAEKRHKAHDKQREERESTLGPSDSAPVDLGETGVYEQEMDEMRCILYAHGGGYYFGSVDQERYCIQRHARKINGRVLAVDYRLSPQYPFPCALQDLLAAYLFLIRPPPGAAHRRVLPEHLTLMGASAGGGLSLALLQALRDTGLPLPAGAVLISPWCDLTHSFPSIHTNTATDVIPLYGLSLQKPSTLWPPPPDEITSRVHAGLRSKIRQFLHPDINNVNSSSISLAQATQRASKDMSIDVGNAASLPSPDSTHDQTISLTTKSGEKLVITDQLQLYAQNSLLAHPLISPALSYLGGLPPLLFVISDKEVLRDEGIYSAHKAAHPELYPVSLQTKKLYPILDGIETRYKSTPVHLQVYDDTAHILPVLFPFTTPGKYCFRAIASFVKHVCGAMNSYTPISSTHPVFSNILFTSPEETPQEDTVKERSTSFFPGTATEDSRGRRGMTSSSLRAPKLSMRRSLSSLPARAASVIRSNSYAGRRPQSPSRKQPPMHPDPSTIPTKDSDDASSSWFNASASSPIALSDGYRYAGEPIVYSQNSEFPSWNDKMIRERVSTKGVIRPLEPESELPTFHVPQEMIGVLSELAIRRYIEGKAKFDKKFSGAIHTIDKYRSRNLERAKKDTMKNMANIQGHISRNGGNLDPVVREKNKKTIAEGLMAASGSWSWAWALDVDERPPPSSIVSRRDTAEAIRLAKIADQSFLQDDISISGNNLWTVIVNFLSTTPDKYKNSDNMDKDKTGSTFSRLLSQRQSGRVPPGSSQNS